MQLQVYIDSNVYLDLLCNQSVISEEVSKFVSLCENGSIELFIPEQTEKEFHSNREDVVAKTLENLKKSSSIGAFHSFIENHSNFDKIKRLRGELSSQIQLISDRFEVAAKNSELPFDVEFRKLLSFSTRPKSNGDILRKAKERADTHCPPGKGSDLGDRIIWESLLEHGAFAEDIYIISKDKDYQSPLDSTRPRTALIDEWNKVNWASLHLCKSVEEFLKIAAVSDEYLRSLEIGRAIWILNNSTIPEMIEQASENILKNVKVLSKRQISLISQASIVYYGKVFISENSFDDMISKFWDNYKAYIEEGYRQKILNMAEACPFFTN